MLLLDPYYRTIEGFEVIINFKIILFFLFIQIMREISISFF